MRVITVMDRESEFSLVRRLRACEAGAVDEVHAAFNVRLFTFLIRLSRRRDVAEDLLEDTWLQLLRKASSLHPDTMLGPWLFTVARNRYYSYRRARALEEAHAAIGCAGASESTASPFETAAADERERRLEAALAALPTTYREVLLLVGVEGLTPTEAAAVCGIAPATLRQRLHRARALLARRLELDSVQNPTLREVTT